MFMANGAVLGVLALLVQGLLFGLFGGSDVKSYAIASAVTYVPLILLNFQIQRSLIFASSGRLLRFLVANVLIMLLVSFLSPVFRALISAVFGMQVADMLGFTMAALTGATPSFLLSKYWVFIEERGKSSDSVRQGEL